MHASKLSPWEFNRSRERMCTVKVAAQVMKHDLKKRTHCFNREGWNSLWLTLLLLKVGLHEPISNFLGPIQMRFFHPLVLCSSDLITSYIVPRSNYNFQVSDVLARIPVDLQTKFLVVNYWNIASTRLLLAKQKHKHVWYTVFPIVLTVAESGSCKENNEWRGDKFNTLLKVEKMQPTSKLNGKSFLIILDRLRCPSELETY